MRLRRFLHFFRHEWGLWSGTKRDKDGYEYQDRICKFCYIIKRREIG